MKPGHPGTPQALLQRRNSPVDQQEVEAETGQERAVGGQDRRSGEHRCQARIGVPDCARMGKQAAEKITASAR